MSIRIRRMMGCIALVLAVLMVGSAMAQSLAAGETPAVTTVIHTSPFTAAIADVRDSVVGVSNYQKVTYGNYGNDFGSFFFGYGFGYGGRGQQEPETREELASTGSGVVVGEGLILTNYHVVEDASALKVTVTDDAGETTEYAAALVIYDEAIDAALLYAPDCKLPAVTLGDSDTLMVGDWAICIGNPLGFAKTTTAGIVSALNRAVESETYDKYGRRETISNAMIQVDAAINSGNSGGGMFSVTGELMGIPTLKYSGSYYSSASVEGIGMCIPVNAIKPMLEEVTSGRVQLVPPETKEDEAGSDGIDMTGRPRLGISITDLNTSNYAVRTGQIPLGAYVVEVEAGSPAELGGIQAGDIIVDINDKVIASVSDLQNTIAQYNAGDVLNVKVYRAPGITGITGYDDAPEGEYIDLEITLAVIDAVKQ